MDNLGLMSQNQWKSILYNINNNDKSPIDRINQLPADCAAILTVLLAVGTQG